jgi:hypothetical protein
LWKITSLRKHGGGLMELIAIAPAASLMCIAFAIAKFHARRI